MWELDCKESWAPKNWCFWTVVLEKTLESPLDCKEIQPVHPEGNQSWVFIGRADADDETPVLWPPHLKSWLIGKDSDAGRDWGQEDKGTTEDEMAGWHHRLNGHVFGWTPGVGDGQGVLACCDSWGRKESDVTEQLKWTELIKSLCFSLTVVAAHSPPIPQCYWPFPYIRWTAFLLPFCILTHSLNHLAWGIVEGIRARQHQDLFLFNLCLLRSTTCQALL